MPRLLSQKVEIAALIAVTQRLRPLKVYLPQSAIGYIVGVAIYPAQLRAAIFRRIKFHLFLYVMTIPTTEAIKTNGAILTNTNSKPCKIVPATASSGLL